MYKCLRHDRMNIGVRCPECTDENLMVNSTSKFFSIEHIPSEIDGLVDQLKIKVQELHLRDLKLAGHEAHLLSEIAKREKVIAEQKEELTRKQDLIESIGETCYKLRSMFDTLCNIGSNVIDENTKHKAHDATADQR